MECNTVIAPAAAASAPRVRAPRKPKAAAVEEAAAELAPQGLEAMSSSDQPPTRARSRTPRAPRTKAAEATPEPELKMMPPPPKRVRAPRKPKAAAETMEPVDQMQVLLPVVDGAFLASLSGTLKTLRKKTRDKISALPIA